MDAESSLTYTLFLYREQLSQSLKHELRLSYTKITLTDKLIRKTTTMDSCTMEDMLAINRGIVLKQKLKYHMHRMRQLKKSQMAQQKNNPVFRGTNAYIRCFPKLPFKVD